MLTFKRLKLAVFGVAWLLLFCVEVGEAQTLRLSVASSVDLGRWVGIGDREGITDVCVFNSSGSNYTMTATAGGSFQLTGGAGSLVYSVSFSDTGSSGVFTNLPHGSARNFSGADQSSETCGGGFNASVKIAVAEAALGAARPGNYSGTVTLTLAAAP
jgi:hypothetical protein